jgi:hypothetical protein
MSRKTHRAEERRQVQSEAGTTGKAGSFACRIKASSRSYCWVLPSPRGPIRTIAALAVLITVDGAAAPRDSALLSAVGELRLRNGFSFIAKADGEFASRATTYAGTGTARYTW